MVPEVIKLSCFWKKDIIHTNCTYNYEQIIVYYYKGYKSCCGKTKCCEKVQKGELTKSLELEGRREKISIAKKNQKAKKTHTHLC